MEHLKDEEILKYVKAYYDEGTVLDSSNNLNSEFTQLAKKVNTHISTCEECHNRLRHLKDNFLNGKDKPEEIKEEIKIQGKSEEENFEVFNGQDDLLDENLAQNNSFQMTEESIEYYANNINELYNSGLAPAQIEAYLRAIRTRARKQQMNTNSGGRQLVLTGNSGGFADALILALITGFAGGIFLTVILMLCK